MAAGLGNGRDGKPHGPSFNDGDFLKWVEALSQIYAVTRDPKIAAPGQLAVEALAFMNETKITRLFVLEEGDAAKKPVGILHIHDCLRAGIA